LNRFSWNQEELFTYDQAEKYEWDYLACMEQKYDEGKADVAKKMLAQNFDVSMIASLTGLSVQKIESLKE
jgi:hypothetical protein